MMLVSIIDGLQKKQISQTSPSMNDGASKVLT